MPFTLSHAAVVLPAMRRSGVARGPLVASALVLGSFAPDVPYFMGSFEWGNVSHSLLGVVTVDVVITAALAALWVLVREPLLALLPYGWQARATAVLRGRPFRERERERAVGPLAFWFAISAGLGSLTHVIWDSFTHAGRDGVRAFPALEYEIMGRPLFNLLQYGSSAVGLAIAVGFLLLAVRVAPAHGEPELSGAQRLGVFALLGACLLVPALQAMATNPVLELGVMAAAFDGGAGLGLGAILYAVWFRMRRVER